MRPLKKHTHDPFMLKNMQEAIELVRKHIKNDSKIFVKVDCDVDGVTSSSVLIQFLNDLNPLIEVDWLQNYEKRHGLTYKDLAGHTGDEYGLIIKLKSRKQLSSSWLHFGQLVFQPGARSRAHNDYLETTIHWPVLSKLFYVAKDEDNILECNIDK